MIELNNSNFDEFVASGTVLVDFWATWCAPCKASMPHLEAFAAETPDVKVGKVNVDLFEEIAEQFNVRAVPTLILFRDGVEVKRRTGAVSKAMLNSFISQ